MSTAADTGGLVERLTAERDKWEETAKYSEKRVAFWQAKEAAARETTQLQSEEIADLQDRHISTATERATAVAELAAAHEQIAELERRKDGAYEERNKVVAALAKLFPSGLKATDIAGWSTDWHKCVYIDLPTGQVSWHFHDSQAALFDGLPPYAGEWDGHDTDEKYRRLAALTPLPEGGR